MGFRVREAFPRLQPRQPKPEAKVDQKLPKAHLEQPRHLAKTPKDKRAMACLAFGKIAVARSAQNSS